MLTGLPQFTSAPTSYQFAKDGAWESAWSFPSDRLPSHAELAFGDAKPGWPEHQPCQALELVAPQPSLPAAI